MQEESKSVEHCGEIGLCFLCQIPTESRFEVVQDLVVVSAASNLMTQLGVLVEQKQAEVMVVVRNKVMPEQAQA